MWSVKEGRKHLDITNLRSEFKVISENGLHLVHPVRNMWDWNEDEKWLRSVIVNDDGFVVSCSWPKFGNFGEFLNDTDTLKNELANGGSVNFTHKEDGSLCIRCVVDGQIIMRTRGTLFGGVADQYQDSFGDRFKKVAKEKYPILLDPNFVPEISLLFEYVAPSNVVVIRYKEEDLILLGFIVHDGLHISSWSELKFLAENNNLNLVKIHDLPRDPLKLQEEIKTWKEEGIVARCKGDQVFVKVKSAHYLANHRMKYSMTYPTMVEFIEGGGIKSEKQLSDELYKCDYDWEIIEIAKEFHKIYLEASEIKDSSLKEAQKLYNNFKSDKLDKVAIRKEYAMIACAQKNIVRQIMFCLYDNKPNRLHDYCRKIVLSEGKLIKRRRK